MNITLNKTDSVNATISIEIVKADYENEVEKSFKDLRKNATIPGFRKGMAPQSFLQQKYGKAILFEEINKLVSKSLTDYLKENDLNILGEPMTSNEQASIDFDKQQDFVFLFDIGLSPTIDAKFTKEDKIPYFIIQATDEMINRQIGQIQAQNGKHELAEEVEDKDLVKGNLIELNENGEQKENGMNKKDAILFPAFIKNEDEKAKLINAKLHSTIIFNPFAAYEGNEAEIASFLNIKKEEVNNHTGDFSFEIIEIKRYKDAEINQDLFDKVFEPGTVDSEEKFREKIKEYLTLQLAPESDYKFILDAWKLLEEKVSDMQLPDAFLKRWLLQADTKKTPESIEEDYPKFSKDLKFHIIKEHLIEENNITIEEDELKEYAKNATRAQFIQYGMPNANDDLIENYSQEMLKNKESYRALGDKIFEDKLIKILKEQVTLEPQEITFDEFSELLKEYKNNINS